MFNRSKELAVIAKPIIDQIADSLLLAGFKGLVSDDRTYVESATSGYNFRVYKNEKHTRIQFRMGIQVDNFRLSDANKFNIEMVWGKAIVAESQDSVWLEGDLIYRKHQDNSDIFGEYISLWNLLVGAFVRSIMEAQSKPQSVSPRALTLTDEVSI